MFTALLFVAAVAQGAQPPVLIRDITIGCESCTGPEQFVSVSDVSISPNGEIIVGHRDAPKLRMFGADGKTVWSGGAKGQGPGEYQYIMRTTTLPNGGMLVLDASSLRVTELARDHSVAHTSRLLALPTTAGMTASGALLLGNEGMGGAFTLSRWTDGNAAAISLPPRDAQPAFGRVKSASVALGPNGLITVAPIGDEYVIVRSDVRGIRLPDLKRTVDRVRNDADEEARFRKRRSADIGAVMAEMRGRGSTDPKAPPSIPESERQLKPHIASDGLRYDGAGRLWVRTMRGNMTKTVFDVFTAGGDFAGSVTVTGEILTFAFAGNYMVSAADNADGIPIVTRWKVQ